MRKLLLVATLLLLSTVGRIYAQDYLHPGIDIKPHVVDVSANLVYSTHAGFVTYAGPAPPTLKEKGWLVQIETDLNRDNVADIITRYTHLLPETLTINDVHYRRLEFTPEFYLNYGKSLPYGYGPYVARNQFLGVVGDSGSPGHRHVQYEIITSRFVSLRWNSSLGGLLKQFSCEDDPYLEMCSDDASRPGLFLPINRKKTEHVRAPAYVNPGLITPKPARKPQIVYLQPAITPEVPEPDLPEPDFVIPLPAVTLPPPPPPAPPQVPGVCCANDNYGRQVCIQDGYIFHWDNRPCGGHQGDPCAVSPACGACGTQGYNLGGPLYHEQGCVNVTSYDKWWQEWGDPSCPQAIFHVRFPSPDECQAWVDYP